jgi:hypothetical protein
VGDHGVHRFTEHAGDDTRHDENPDDQAFELTKKNLEGTDAFAFGDFVRAARRKLLSLTAPVLVQQADFAMPRARVDL